MKDQLTYTFTEAELAQAFKIYNTEAITNPGKFEDIDVDDETALAQAKYLLNILIKIKYNHYAQNK